MNRERDGGGRVGLNKRAQKDISLQMVRAMTGRMTIATNTKERWNEGKKWTKVGVLIKGLVGLGERGEDKGGGRKGTKVSKDKHTVAVLIWTIMTRYIRDKSMWGKTTTRE